MPFIPGDWYIYFPSGSYPGGTPSGIGPSNGDTGVAVDSQFSFAIVPDTGQHNYLSGAGIGDNFKVHVNGVLAFDYVSGEFQSGFDGTISFSGPSFIGIVGTPPNEYAAYSDLVFTTHPTFPGFSLITVTASGSTDGGAVSASYSFTTGALYVLVRSSPIDGSNGVLPDAPVQFEFTGPPITPSAVVVKINGVTAYSSGAFLPGYTGTVTYPDSGTADVSIDTHPPFPFSTGMVVTVPGFGISFAFTTEDEPALFRSPSALAVRENAVRVEFTQPVFLNRLLDEFDASETSRWTIIVDPVSLVGIDGQPPRAVAITEIDFAPKSEVGADYGRFVDVVIDRPFSPWPTTYLIQMNTIYNSDKSENIAFQQILIPATYRLIEPPQVDSPVLARDFANPQTLAAARESLPNPNAILRLGTYSVDDTGDYALDVGSTSLKKRIIRRLITIPGGFAHLGDDYGVGVLLYLKQLTSVEVQSRLSTKAEEQIAREPEVAKCRVLFVQDSKKPSLFFMRIYVRTRQGLNQRFELPLTGSLPSAAA